MRDTSQDQLEIPKGVEYVIGVDNGLAGGCILMKVTKGGLVPIDKYPFREIKPPDPRYPNTIVNILDSAAFFEWLSGSEVGARPPSKTVAIVEEPFSTTAKRSGRSSADSVLSTSRTFGQIITVFGFAHIPVMTVPISSWQVSHWGGPKGSRAPWFDLKGEEKPSIKICDELYPDFDWTKSKLGKKPYDAFTDGCLIARFGALKWTSAPVERAAKTVKKKEASARKRARNKEAAEAAKNA